MPTYPPELIDALADVILDNVTLGREETVDERRQRVATAALNHIVGYTGGAGHLVEYRTDGYTLQHPLTERLDGTLFDCDLDQHIQALDGPPALGFHYVFLHEGQLHSTAAEDVSHASRSEGEPT